MERERERVRERESERERERGGGRGREKEREILSVNASFVLQVNDGSDPCTVAVSTCTMYNVH